ncbi:MAG: HAMP domain-containing histidine kinase [Clostridia bacterium]|nr:HAMP domain-containing histidine kinase [Clostridia bacterium]
MKLLKNRETAFLLAVTAILGASASVLCLFAGSLSALICAALTIALIIAIYMNSRKRYIQMSELSERIDSLISGAEDVDIRCYSEGELSILQSELTKLTVKLREQTSALRDDKKLLADSIADISHQIRTPLTAINLLLTEYSKSADEAERANLLSELNRQLARIDRLISALLKLARLDADSVTMETSEVPLKELIREALSPIDIQMELRDQEAVIEAEGTVTCDRSWTAEALTNILKNCSEHMGAGRLYITASDTPLFSEIVIRDTGKGIDVYDLPHIFERFYKGKNSAPSSVGIGLALSRAIIIKQNGTVKAENAREGGAVFTIRFYKGAV